MEAKGDGEGLWLRLHSYIFGVSSSDDQITKTISLHTRLQIHCSTNARSIVGINMNGKL